jgi:ribonuclease J
MLKRPPKKIDVMLMEGASLGRITDTEDFPTEEALERIFIERFKATPGIVLVACTLKTSTAS